MYYISKVLSALAMLSITLFLAFSHADVSVDQTLQIQQSNPLAAVMVEYAKNICDVEMVESFFKRITLNDPFVISLKSKTFPNGLELAKIIFENKSFGLVIERPVQGLQPHADFAPNCHIWTKGLGELQNN